MSVPEGKRTQSRFEVITKARHIVVHTLEVTANEKVFPKKYRWSFTGKLVDETIDMFKNLYIANSIEVRFASDKALRRQYQVKALAQTYSILAMIQIAGVAVLDDMDHMIKENLGAKLYIRYMDDFIIIHNDKKYLEHCLENIKEYLSERGFELNAKTSIYRISQGIKFLGFRFMLTESGKVLRLILSEKVKRERRKLRKLVKLAKKGKLTKKKVDECYNSWKSHVSGSKKKHCAKRKKRHNYKNNTYKVLQRMDAFYEELWKED